MKRLPITTMRVVWLYRAERMTATELEQLIARLQVQEQNGEGATYALYHLMRYYESQFEQK